MNLNGLIMMNKNIIAYTTFLLGYLCSQAHAEQSSIKECEKLLDAGVTAQIEELTCGYTGKIVGTKDLSISVMRLYDNKKCRYIVPQSTVDTRINKLSKREQVKVANLGEKKYCESNIRTYFDAIDAVKKLPDK